MERVAPTIDTGMFLGVKAKKHLTVYKRKETSPGAGSPKVKDAFKDCAESTLGEPNRLKRNVKLQDCMIGKGLRTGVTHKKSGARAGSPLYGKTRTCDEGGCRYN